MPALSSTSYEVEDALAAIEFYMEQGWTDGLPIIPPTEDRVLAMLDAGGLRPHDIICEVPTRQRTITAEKVAINAVMAGCKPEYFPVVVAAVEAMGAPEFGIHGPAASTAGAAILLIVNGPIARELGLNATHNIFGPRYRSNATIGRSIRLLLMNGLGAIPGVLDRSTLGHPGKFTYCIAEDEENSPWPPLHVERGFQPHDSVVTIFAGEGPHQVNNHGSATAEGICATLADTMIAGGVHSISGGGSQWTVVICPEHRDTIAGDGWGKQEIREYLVQNARRSYADCKRLGRMRGPIQPGDEERRVQMIDRPEDILVVAGGGTGGRWSAVIPGWSTKASCQIVSRRIRRP
jgi:hypothetical protein